MIDHLGQRRGLDRQEAYALCSVACDLRVHEVVDAPNWVVGMFLPEAVFGPQRVMSARRRREELRRELRFWETIALSVGIMAPTAAMALNGVGVSASIGRAVPLAFLISGVLVFLVSWSFITALGALQPRRLGVRLQRRHAGAASRLLLRLGAARHLPRLHGRLVGRGGAVPGPVRQRHGAVERQRVDLDLARRGARDRHPRLQRHQADDPHPDQHGGGVGAR